MEDKNEQVYSQYDINVINTYRIKGTTYLECSDGLRVLKAYEYSEKKAEIENAIKKELVNRGFIETDLFERNKEGLYITQNRYGNKFVVKRWFNGEECNLNSEDELRAAIIRLTQLHGYLKNFVIDDNISDKICKKRIINEYISYNQEIKRVKKYILNKKKKNKLETEFLQSIDYYYNQALETSKLLSDNNYEENCCSEDNMLSLCHGSYNQHNIIMDTKIAITNFGKSFYGVQVYDLYCLLRKVMEKNNWDIRLGSKLIEEYDKKKTLSNSERQMLKLFISYPEKYHKLINSYYNSQKVWVSGRIIQKLADIESLEEKRKEFILQL